MEAIGAPGKVPSDLAARVHAARIRLFYKQQLATIAASSVIAVLLVLILWSESGSPLLLIGWLAAMLAVQFTRLLIRFLYFRASPSDEAASGWARLAITMTAAAGICWGGSVLLFFDPMSSINLIVTTMTATGIAAGGLAVLSALPVAYLAYLFTHIPPLIVLLLIAGGFVPVVFAASFVFFMLVLISSVRTIGAMLEESLRLRFERIGMIEHLDEARVHAESASRAKSEFLAMMTHELKTPLNSIIGYAALIDSLPGATKDKKLEGYTSEIHDGARRLLALINDILDISRADAGRMTLQEGLFSIGVAIERCRWLVAHHAEDAKVELKMESLEALPAVRGDERLIRQAILNLLSNAIKFTPAGGSVRIGARRLADGTIAIEVSDTGIGIAVEDLPRAMEPFEQISRGHARERGGSGLGLPLAKRIAEQHRGRLEIESRAGAGTIARLILPADRVAQ